MNAREFSSHKRFALFDWNKIFFFSSPTKRVMQNGFHGIVRCRSESDLLAFVGEKWAELHMRSRSCRSLSITYQDQQIYFLANILGTFCLGRLDHQNFKKKRTKRHLGSFFVLCSSRRILRLPAKIYFESHKKFS